MRYTIYIMLNAEDDFRKEELEIPEEFQVSKLSISI